MTEDLPDYTNEVCINVDIPERSQVIARPTGIIPTKGAGVDTSGGGVVTIAERVVTDTKTYHIANLHVSAKTAHWLYLYIDGVEKRRYYNPGSGDTDDWFIWDWNNLLGVGVSKKVELKAEKDGAGETLYGDFCGEEV